MRARLWKGISSVFELVYCQGLSFILPIHQAMYTTIVSCQFIDVDGGWYNGVQSETSGRQDVEPHPARLVVAGGRHDRVSSHRESDP